MSIAINSNPERNQLIATAGQTVFTYTFPIFSDTYLSVFQYADGVMPNDLTQKLTLGVDYSVTGVGTETGGTVILVVPAAVNDIITIMGTQPIERESQFQDLNPFTVALNQQFNESTVMAQQSYTYWNDFTVRYNADELISAPTASAPSSPGVRPLKRILPMLPDGYVWVGRGSIGATHDDIIALPYPTGGGGGGGTTQTITQSTAGLAVGNWVRISNPSGLYVKAQGDNAQDGEVVGVIIDILSSTQMIVQQSGYIVATDLVFTGLTPGAVYFLDTFTAGAMSLSDALFNNQVSRPVFVADTASSGWVLPYRGLIVGGAFPQVAGSSTPGTVLTSTPTGVSFSSYAMPLPSYAGSLAGDLIYYAATGIGHPIGDGALSSFTLTSGTIYYVPFCVMNTDTFGAIAFYLVTGVAASNAALAIYNSVGGLQPAPGTIIAGSSSGSISTAVGAQKIQYIFGTPIQLIAGRIYWLSLSGSSSSLVVSGSPANQDYSNGMFGYDLDGTNKHVLGWTIPGAYNPIFPTPAAGFVPTLFPSTGIPLISLIRP